MCAQLRSLTIAILGPLAGCDVLAAMIEERYTRRVRVLVASALLAGCLHTNTVTCPDGTTCGPDATCVSIDINGTAQTICATPDQLAQCAGKSDGDACERPDAPGSCHAGACLISTCGNFLKDANELCDDGNNVSGDRCSADCASDERCGNGFVDVSMGEECDADNVLGHDGCSSDCRERNAGMVAA